MKIEAENNKRQEQDSSLEKMKAVFEKNLIKSIQENFTEFAYQVAQGDSANTRQDLLQQIYRNNYFKELLNIIHDMNSTLDLEILLRRILDACILFLEAERGAILLKDERGELILRQARNDKQEDMKKEFFVVPKTVKNKILQEGKTLFIPDLLETNILSSFSITDMKLRSIMVAPLWNTVERSDGSQKASLLGIIYLDSQQSTCKSGFVENNLELLRTLADQASVTLHNSILKVSLEKTIEEKSAVARALEQEILERKAAEEMVRLLNENLEEKIREKTAELEKAHKNLLENTYKAGMADISTAVLHNVCNALTSAATSAQEIKHLLSNSKIPHLFKANVLLKENMNNLEQFLFHDSRGRTLLEYYFLLGDTIQNEFESLSKNINRVEEMHRSIHHIVESQQQYYTPPAMESLQVTEVIDETLAFLEAELTKKHITVRKEYENIECIDGQKFKIKHMLTNIIKNAIEALEEIYPHQRSIMITVRSTDTGIRLSISDTGKGIAPEIFPKVFIYGFTTKQDHHGFGLNTCANYIAELGGHISLENPQKDKGTTVHLDFDRQAGEIHTIKR